MAHGFCGQIKNQKDKVRISHILTFNPLASANAHQLIKSALKVSHLQSLKPQIYPCYISHNLAQNHL